MHYAVDSQHAVGIEIDYTVPPTTFALRPEVLKKVFAEQLDGSSVWRHRGSTLVPGSFGQLSSLLWRFPGPKGFEFLKFQFIIIVYSTRTNHITFADEDSKQNNSPPAAFDSKVLKASTGVRKP